MTAIRASAGTFLHGENVYIGDRGVVHTAVQYLSHPQLIQISSSTFSSQNATNKISSLHDFYGADASCDAYAGRAHAS